MSCGVLRGSLIATLPRQLGSVRSQTFVTGQVVPTSGLYVRMFASQYWTSGLCHSFGIDFSMSEGTKFWTVPCAMSCDCTVAPSSIDRTPSLTFPDWTSRVTCCTWVGVSALVPLTLRPYFFSKSCASVVTMPELFSVTSGGSVFAAARSAAASKTSVATVGCDEVVVVVGAGPPPQAARTTVLAAVSARSARVRGIDPPPHLGAAGRRR